MPGKTDGGVPARRQEDLETAVRQKLVTNAAKYPVEKAKGVATQYDRL